MSKAKDRARAKSGVIFRDGKLVNASDWYASHLTPEMKEQRQEQVDNAIAELMKGR